MESQSSAHRLELIHSYRMAQSCNNGIYTTNTSDKERIFAAQLAIGDWNRGNAQGQILLEDILLPSPTTVKSFHV